MNNKTLVRRCNRLARKFYAMQGYEVRKGFKFYDSMHPQERGCWNMAVAAYEHIRGDEVDGALDELRDEG